MLRIVIDQEFGFKTWLWEFDGNDDQLASVWEDEKPSSCLDPVSKLPGTVTEQEAGKFPSNCQYYAFWHEKDDSNLIPIVKMEEKIVYKITEKEDL
ncbi:MAG: hypothetical protein QF569_23565 [Candidatus Poribacteria bacterium]|nr:hypothetical protein [Candidatus Poribacteria bacterium]